MRSPDRLRPPRPGLSVWLRRPDRRRRHRCRRSRRIRCLVRRALDGELAIVLDEDEDVADRLRRRSRGQNHVPGQVTVFRFDRAEGRNRGGVEVDPEPTQFPQFAEQQQRVDAIQENGRPRPKADAPIVRDTAWCTRRGRRRGVRRPGGCPTRRSTAAVPPEYWRSGGGPRCRGRQPHPTWSLI